MKDGIKKSLTLTWEDYSGNSFTNHYSTESAAFAQFLYLRSFGLKVKLESR